MLPLHLNSLSKKGFIERNKDENDKRMVIVTITEAGKSFMLEEHEKAIAMLEKTLEKLGERDAKEFVRILNRIIENATEDD